MKVDPSKDETEAAYDANNFAAFNGFQRTNGAPRSFAALSYYEKTREEHRNLLISAGPVNLRLR